MPEHARRAGLRAAGVSRLDGSVSSAMSSHTGVIWRRGVATARLLLIAVAFLSTRGSAAGVVGSEMSTGPAAYMHWPVPRPSWDGQGTGGSNGLSSHRRLRGRWRARRNPWPLSTKPPNALSRVLLEVQQVSPDQPLRNSYDP